MVVIKVPAIRSPLRNCFPCRKTPIPRCIAQLPSSRRRNLLHPPWFARTSLFTYLPSIKATKTGGFAKEKQWNWHNFAICLAVGFVGSFAVACPASVIGVSLTQLAFSNTWVWSTGTRNSPITPERWSEPQAACSRHVLLRCADEAGPWTRTDARPPRRRARFFRSLAVVTGALRRK